MKKFIPTLFTILGVGLLAVVLVKVPLGDTWIKLRNTQWGLAGIGLVLILLMILIKGVRWSYLLRMQGVSYPVWDAFLIYLGSLYWGTVTPGRVGDFIKVLYLRRDRGMSVGQGMSSVLVDRVFDLYILLILGCTGLMLHPLPGHPELMKGVWVFFGILILISFLAFHRKTGEYLVKTVFQKALGDKLQGHAEDAFQDFHKGMEAFYRPAILWPIFLTAASYVTFFTGCWVLALAMGIGIKATYLAFCIAVVNIVSLVSFAGVGTREATFILLFGLQGFTQSEALAYSTLFFVVGSIGICLIGFLAYLMKPVKFEKDAPLSGAE